MLQLKFASSFFPFPGVQQPRIIFLVFSPLPLCICVHEPVQWWDIGYTILQLPMWSSAFIYCTIYMQFSIRLGFTTYSSHFSIVFMVNRMSLGVSDVVETSSTNADVSDGGNKVVHRNSIAASRQRPKRLVIAWHCVVLVKLFCILFVLFVVIWKTNWLASCLNRRQTRLSVGLHRSNTLWIPDRTNYTSVDMFCFKA